jgi:segregation and condensation protein A
MTAATTPQTQQQTEPVDVLVEMAREGEIDPWDVDIVEVTDKFLERLDDGDLVRSGRALLYASILLRMKSDYIVEEEEDENEEPEMEWRGGAPPDEAFDEASMPSKPSSNAALNAAACATRHALRPSTS